MPSSSRLSRLLGLRQHEEDAKRNDFGVARSAAADASEHTQRSFDGLQSLNLRNPMASGAELASLGLARSIAHHAVDAAKAHELHLTAVADAVEQEWLDARQEVDKIERLVDRHDLEAARRRAIEEQNDLQDLVGSRDDRGGAQ